MQSLLFRKKNTKQHKTTATKHKIHKQQKRYMRDVQGWARDVKA